MAEEASKVFISYSWDSEKHKEDVLALANTLRTQWEIDADIDRYVRAEPPFTPREGWDLWMQKRIDWAEFVLIVCTETYKRRFEGDEEPGRGLGVSWEGTIIRQSLYNDQSRNTKFIPVVFSHEDLIHVPLILNASDKYILNEEKSYIELCYRLRKQGTVIKPEIGKIDLESPPEPAYFSPVSPNKPPITRSPVASDIAEVKDLKKKAGKEKADSRQTHIEDQPEMQANTTAKSKPQKLVNPPKRQAKDGSFNTSHSRSTGELEEVIKIVDKAYARRARRPLNDIQRAIVQGAWYKWSYEKIANNSKYNCSTLETSGPRLWQCLSESLGEKVNKNNFREVVKRYLPKREVLNVVNSGASIQICEYTSTLSGHSGWINSIIINSNRQIISGSQDGTIKIWNLDTGEPLGNLGTPRNLRDFWKILSKKHSDRVHSVAISSDSKVLASASEDRTVIVWDLVTYGNLYLPLRHSGAVYCVAISPDNQLLASGCSDHTIFIWDLKTGKQIKRFIERDSIRALIFSPNEQTLISASEDKIIKVWSVQHWSQQNLPFDESSPDSLTFSADGKLLAISYKNRNIKIIDFHQRKQLYSLSGQVVAFSPDNEIIATALDKEISFWKQATGELLCSPVGAGNLVRCLAFSNDGWTLVSGQGEEIKIWRVRKDKLSF